MIKVENVSFSYKKHNKDAFRLRDINFEVKKGEMVALIGPSGSGKTTLLRCINGLYKVNSGYVSIMGINIDKIAGGSIGMIFQNFNLLLRSTVLENVLWGRLGYKGSFSCYTQTEKDIALKAIRCVGLSDYANSRVDTLSGGQQQRVGIARTLTQESRIILADEPVSNLDIKTKKNILKLLYDINKTQKITIMISIHNLNIIKGFVKRVIAISNGRIVFDGDIKNLTKKKLNEIFT